MIDISINKMNTHKVKMKALILFAGTGSIERGLENINRNKNFDIEFRGLDLDKKWKHYYALDILKWDYKQELKDWTPDYIHSSFVCCQFSALKNGSNQQRDLSLGYSLLNKSIEIFNYVKSINPNVLITAENPRNKFVKAHEEINKYHRHLTHYCKYAFRYHKPTFFWSSINLNLRMCSKKTGYCDHKKKYNYHEVNLGFRARKPHQTEDSGYFRLLKKDKLIPRGFSDQYMRYRIPQALVYDILDQITDKYLEIKQS